MISSARVRRLIRALCRFFKYYSCTEQQTSSERKYNLRKNSLLIMILLLPLSPPVKAQDGEAEAEINSVRRVVETYLYAEELEEKRRVLYPKAKIYSVNETGIKLTETLISAPAKKMPKGAKTGRSTQRVVDIDVAGEGAVVKVETDSASGEVRGWKHIQYISLLKVGGEWKIVSILMPPVRFKEM